MEPAQKIQDLVAWQLACRLRDLIDRMTEGERVQRDVSFRDQIRNASASVASNLAEGFGRYYPKSNAAFVRIAKGSLTETQNHLKHGRKKKYWNSDDYETAWRLSCRTMKATSHYLVYLEACNNEVPSREEPRAQDSEVSTGEPATQIGKSRGANPDPRT